MIERPEVPERHFTWVKATNNLTKKHKFNWSNGLVLIAVRYTNGCQIY